MNVPLQLKDFRPPCSRHDDASDDADSRTKMVWPYAMGLFDSAVGAIGASHALARLHDHKGFLYIVMKSDLPNDKLEAALRRAWAELASEDPSAVEVLVVGSQEYEKVWSARRFA